MRPNVREIATGKWRGLLLGFGLTERQLSGKHCSCPICGGNDRFRFDDKEGRGTYYCRCGAGDGIKLVMAVKGWDFKTAAREIEQAAGVVQAGPIHSPQGEAEKVEKLRRIWSESKPLQVGDEAMRYLAGRGLSLPVIPGSLRLHPNLAYYDGETFAGKFPAMVARVVGVDGSGLTLHRTYLQDGRKAPVDEVKKLMSGKSISGGAIRLAPASRCLGIAEGIETSLAASALFGLPVWSCISAHGIETFVPPEAVEQLIIFADNDASFTGQRAAYATAFRLKQQGIEVDVRIPDVPGDWLDVLNATRKAAA
uniref:DNA primase/helicase Gp4 N-terminal Bacteriophage T7-like domain-containing protein n=1 Tax=Dechloromonas aromatica (strain RCB) TaxID=159087 RepID=Q47CK7_DECAR